MNSVEQVIILSQNGVDIEFGPWIHAVDIILVVASAGGVVCRLPDVDIFKWWRCILKISEQGNLVCHIERKGGI